MKPADLMHLALTLAKEGLGRTSPNPAVGAVVVRNGEIVGKGFHEKAGGPHAEIVALREAGERARGGTLYVTLEPCCHFGKTPPCTDAIVAAGIKEVRIAVQDPHPLVNGRGIEMIRSAGITVHLGLCAQEAVAINEGFFHLAKTGLPFVTAKFAMTLDGKIAPARPLTPHGGEGGESDRSRSLSVASLSRAWITGKEARSLVHLIRSQQDGIIVGIGTVLADNPSLTSHGAGKNPVRIVVDSTGRIPLDSALVSTAREVPLVIFTTHQIPDQKAASLRKRGAEVLLVEQEGKRINLPSMLRFLAQKGMVNLLLEGGGTLNGSFFRQELVHKVLCFIAPKLLGGDGARSPFEGEGFHSMKEALSLGRMTSRFVGNDLLIEGYVHRNH